MALVKFKNTTTLSGLEESLIFLCSFGEPKLSKMSDGWYARIDMFVSSKGASFEISSQFDHKTPMEAVNTLIDRVKRH